MMSGRNKDPCRAFRQQAVQVAVDAASGGVRAAHRRSASERLLEAFAYAHTCIFQQVCPLALPTAASSWRPQLRLPLHGAVRAPCKCQQLTAFQTVSACPYGVDMFPQVRDI